MNLDEPWPAGGCGLAEALLRTADRDQVAEIRRLKALQPARRTYGFEEGRIALNERHRLGVRISSADAILKKTLRDFLERGDLVAYGRANHLASSLEPIPPDIWPALSVIKYQSSSAHEKRENGDAYLLIKVFPVLKAPCAVDCISNRTLAEVFRRFVLGDPEVLALGALAVKDRSEFQRTLDGRCHPAGCAEWRVADDDPTLLASWGQHPFGLLADPPPPSVVAAARALTDRFVALFDLLRRRALVAHGVPQRSNLTTEVPAAVWSHLDFWFEARNGDLFETNQHSRNEFVSLVKRWSAVSLTSPEQKQPAGSEPEPVPTRGEVRKSAMTDVENPPRRRARPRQDEVYGAMRRAGVDLSRGPKAIAQQIAPALSFPVKSRQQELALQKTVSRALEEMRRRGDVPSP